jgi:hypothetical protein
MIYGSGAPITKEKKQQKTTAKQAKFLGYLASLSITNIRRESRHFKNYHGN